MPAPSSSIPATPRKRRGRFRLFGGRVTEGLELEQLWGQFWSDAKASYDLYSREVAWEEIGRTKRGGRRFWRRVLLLAAMVLLVVQPDVRGGRHEVAFQFGWVGTVTLFVLLALELADRVTMKRDLEIAREIQQQLVPEKAPVVPGFDIAYATRPQNTVAGDY